MIINDTPFIAHQIILKMASRCNLNCSYCHWFRDPEVLNQPKIWVEEIEIQFFKRLENYIRSYKLEKIDIVFHGGEPLLYPMKHYQRFVDKKIVLEQNLGMKIDLAMSTNGVLLTKEWVEFLKTNKIMPSVSIDGPKEIHDLYRVDHRGKGSFDKVVLGIRRLQNAGLNPGILCVSDVTKDPKTICDFLVNELKVINFDLLIPNFTVDDGEKGIVKHIAPFYMKLFDLWYDELGAKGITIRYLESLAKTVLGIPGGMQGMGQATLATLEVLPDGSIEPHDVLRIGGNQNVNTQLNVKNNEFEEVFSNPVWMKAFMAAQTPSETCRKCDYLNACGGGDVMHRYSKKRDYDNPSVYCSDLQLIYDHAYDRIVKDLSFKIA
ncbi:radical SAM protein [Bacteriovoracaceae bacterium]|nr:radical SAM protein [Bacteriovoracaceae bacterium]